MRLSILIAVAAVAVSLAGCKTKAYHNCVERGIATHKEIGSWPKMKSADFAGEDAQKVIEKRCWRSENAY